MANRQHDTSSPCIENCVAIDHFQSERSPLAFSRYSKQLGNAVPTWKHNYSLRLTKDGDTFVIYTAHGQRHSFSEQPDHTYSPTSHTQGTLEKRHDQFLWTDPQGVQYTFIGSYPVSVQYPNGQSLQLHYADGQLKTVHDTAGQRIQFSQLNNGVERVSLPNAKSITYQRLPCISDSPEKPAHPSTSDCDADQPSLDSMERQAAQLEATFVDTRPAPCQSHFIEHYGATRGAAIEQGLTEQGPYSGFLTTSHSFPIVDFFNSRELVMIRSRDLASPSFNSSETPNSLYYRLMRDGSQAHSALLEPLRTGGFITLTEQGQTTHLTHQEQQQFSLHLVVRYGMVSESHKQQIDRARKSLLERYGIHLQLVLIP